jgi:hypothetical protein
VDVSSTKAHILRYFRKSYILIPFVGGLDLVVGGEFLGRKFEKFIGI